MNIIRQLRIAGIAEGISYVVLLFIAMPLKYVAGYPLAVTITGSLHGFLFILYILAMVRATAVRKWNLKKNLEVFFAAFIPFGTFILDRKLREEEKELSTSN